MMRTVGISRWGRWRAWAEALLGRHLRRTARPGWIERVLARRPAMSLVRERWLLASRTLLPQIHLAIQPLLRPRLWQARPVLVRPNVPAGPAASVSAGQAGLDGRPGPAGQPGRLLARLRETAAAGPARPAAATEAMVFRPAAPAPLRLVLQRLREPERTLGTASTTRLEPHPQLAREIAGKVRRTERPPAAAPARVLPRREEPPESPGFASPMSSREPQRWNGAASMPPISPISPIPPQPAVNVAALADRVMQQIDDRLHAWRERTGL